MRQQSSSADTKPVVRRNSEPIIFDLREGHDEAEDHGIRVIHSYIGDDDDEMSHVKKEKASLRKTSWRLRMRSPTLGDLEHVAISIDSGADVALVPLSMADHGEGELEFNSATKP